MSNAKPWSNRQFIVYEERKESRSLYLALKHWDLLEKVGKTSPSEGVRKIIAIYLENKNDSEG